MVTVRPPSKRRGQRDATNHAIITASGDQRSLDDIDVSLVKDLYRQHGAILFRGFDLSIEGFRDFTSAFCSHSIVNTAGKRELVDAQSRIQTVNRGQAPFPLHPELSPEPWRPDVCFFACMSPPSIGGETTFCDGIQIVRKLPPPTVKALLPRTLKYALTATARELRFWLGTETPDDEQLNHSSSTCPYQFHRGRAQITRTYTTPVLHKPMFAEKLAFGNFLLFARFMRQDRIFPSFEDDTPVPDRLVEDVKTVSDKLTYAHQWQRGDVLMLDNTRFMHGRRPVLDSAERYILTYFGYLRFAKPSKLEPADAPWRTPHGMAALEGPSDQASPQRKITSGR